MQRLRLRDAADARELIALVRTLMREHRKRVASWWVSDWSTPADLEALLLAQGLRIVEDDYDIGALALVAEPPPAPREIEVRRIESLVDYVAAEQAAWAAFGTPEYRRTPLDALPAQFEADRAAAERVVHYAAWIDGRIAGTARAFFGPRGALLGGGSTVPEFRGRGVYRALVRARWDDAAARGTPALVVQAGAMSEPILLRLGFREVCRFRRLEDVFDAA